MCNNDVSQWCIGVEDIEAGWIFGLFHFCSEAPYVYQQSNVVIFDGNEDLFFVCTCTCVIMEVVSEGQERMCF